MEKLTELILVTKAAIVIIGQTRLLITLCTAGSEGRLSPHSSCTFSGLILEVKAEKNDSYDLTLSIYVLLSPMNLSIGHSSVHPGSVRGKAVSVVFL